MPIRKLLEVGKSCPKEMLYLETGAWPIRFIIREELNIGTVSMFKMNNVGGKNALCRECPYI